MRVFGSLSVILACGLLAACDSASDVTNIGAGGCKPLNYGNGVYYFPCTKADFGNALSKFKADHPHLSIAAMTGNGTAPYGRDRGYFVTVE